MLDGGPLLAGTPLRSDEATKPTQSAFDWLSSRKRSQTGHLTMDVKEQAKVELLPHKGSKWRWLNSVAFWSAACFAIGSMLFITGAASGMLHTLTLEISPWKQRVLVDYSYAIGGCYFSAGAYLGFYEVINFGRDERQLWARPSNVSNLPGYWGTLSYFIGASCFQVAVFAALFGPTLGSAWIAGLEWVPQALGGLLFTTAACIELSQNWHATSDTHVYWVCWLYLYGSILFFAAASTGLYKALADRENETLGAWGVDFPYLVGSCAFLFGAWSQLMMWKVEQFGFGRIAAINHDWMGESLAALSPRAIRAATAEDKLALAVQITLAALSALNMSFSFVWHRFAKFEVSTLRLSHAETLLEGEELLSDFTGVIAAHSILLLATAIHYRPSLQPYGELLWVLRGYSILLLATGIVRLVKYMNEASSCGEVPDEPHFVWPFG